MRTDYGYLTNSELRRLIKCALECGDREGAALYQVALDEHNAYDNWLGSPPDDAFDVPIVALPDGAVMDDVHVVAEEDK